MRFYEPTQLLADHRPTPCGYKHDHPLPRKSGCDHHRRLPAAFISGIAASKEDLFTGGGAIWRGLLVLLGGMPGTVTMIGQFGDVLPQLIQAR